MKGHARKRGKTWVIVYDLDRDPTTGKRRQKWEGGFRTRKQADARLADVQHALNTGMYIGPTKMTFGQLLERWLTDYVATNVTLSTSVVYEQHCAKHIIPALGSIQLRLLNPQHLQRYYTEKLKNGRLDGNGGLTARTVRHHHTTIHTALVSAVKWDLVVRNVADSVHPPKYEQKEMSVLAPQDLPRVMEAAKSTPYYHFYYLAAYTGARRGELLALRWKDVNLSVGKISINNSVTHMRGKVIYKRPKTAKSRRLIGLPQSATIVLAELSDEKNREMSTMGVEVTPEDLVFSNAIGEPIHPDTVTHEWLKLMKRLGIKNFRLQDLRHTHASILLPLTTSKAVSEKLGHASVQITLDTYSHMLPGMEEESLTAFDAVLGTTPSTDNSH